MKPDTIAEMQVRERLQRWVEFFFKLGRDTIYNTGGHTSGRGSRKAYAAALGISYSTLLAYMPWRPSLKPRRLPGLGADGMALALRLRDLGQFVDERHKQGPITLERILEKDPPSVGLVMRPAPARRSLPAGVVDLGAWRQART
jgi:hypothetical protein